MCPTISELLRNHVSLSIASVDRLYVNGWIPRLQTPGQLCIFLQKHLGKPVPSPALLGPIREHFVSCVREFASSTGAPIVPFERHVRKDDIAKEHRARFESDEGVVFIGVAQERCSSFKATKNPRADGYCDFNWSRQSVYVNHYYFYVQDLQWGPAFIKVGSYTPYPLKLCLNGHEWAKQRLRSENIAFESLDNGFLSCEDPERLQAIADSLAASDVQTFFDRWRSRLPWPLTAEDDAAGYGHKLSIWEIELSLTQVFERPVQGRLFFEQVIRDNFDLGRPDRVALLFPTGVRTNTPPPKKGYRTRVITEDVQPSLHVEHKRSHVKQYFKEQRALRTETTINNPEDFYVNKGIESLERLRDIGQAVNQRLLEVERVTQDCALDQEELDHLQHSTRVDSQRASALRFGDTRVMALFAAVCLFRHLFHGFQHRDLRAQVAVLLGIDIAYYSPGKMTYDLRRLRLKGLIRRVPRTHRYLLTPFGLRAAFFHSKVHLRILRPAWAALSEHDDGIPRPLRIAFKRVEEEIAKFCEQACLTSAA